MKKNIAFLLAFCIIQNSNAQKILVPYRSGKLFGLSDGNGKIVVKPAYDDVYWMQGEWFKTDSKRELKDTLETAPQQFYIRNTTAKLSGLIHNGKVILKDEPFDDYEIIIGKLIAAKYEGRPTSLTKEQYKKYGDKRKFYSLFNLNGENLYPGNFKRIQKMDTAGVSSNKNGCKYILLWVVNFNDKHSLLVFDSDKQEISDWLIKDAYKIEPERNREQPTEMLLSITDSNRLFSIQKLEYSTGKFLLQPTTDAPMERRSRRDEDNTTVVQEISSGGMGSGNGMKGDGGGSMVEAPPAREGKLAYNEPKFITYYSRVKDSLFITNAPKIFKPVPLPAGSKIILMEPLGMTQYQPVITKHENHFYIVAGEQPGTKAYDSLVYFGQYFLAWKKINGQTKAGIITSSDSVIVPFVYDSLYAGIRYVDLVNKTPASNTPHYQMEFKEADSKYDYTIKPYKRTFINYVTVFSNGKCGVVTIKGDTIIPFTYELIGKNNLQHSRPRTDDFILLKQNGRYGLTVLKYDRSKNHEMPTSTIAPVFKYIPGFYYSHYYGIKNFRLIGLYNEQREFMGYASEDGRLFYLE